MTQELALHILKSGANVFLTGEPGAGKTYVLNRYLAHLSACDVSVAVTASTGIASTHIGGLTIHSWSGIGARDTITDQDLDMIMQKERHVKRIRKANVLVIDEISMLAAPAFDAVERICRVARGNGEAFGGLQVVVVGDFFQLPPITPYGSEPRFAFEGAAWSRAQFLTCYLREQHRQEDELLLGLLSAIRRGDIEEDHYSLLAEQTEIGFENIEPTRLFTHNKDVDALNLAELAKLRGPRKRFTMRGTGSKPMVEGLMKTCLSPQTLDLAVDAMVMCTKNNFEAGYVNGTLGRVIDFAHGTSYPIIETSDGRRITVEPATWTIAEDGKVRAEIAQMPLRLAWAITIHKSQGMSLDAAEIDLRNAFAFGQGYVALSRVRTLQGMKILGVGPNALMIDPRVLKADDKFRVQSDEVEEAFGAMDDAEQDALMRKFIERAGGVVRAVGDVDTDIAVRAQKQTMPTEHYTKELYDKGLSVPAIAQERGLTASTIWGHVETLVTNGSITEDMIDGRITGDDFVWEDAYTAMAAAIDVVGPEKLKPIFEHLKEVYSYEIIRVARGMWQRNRAPVSAGEEMNTGE